MPWWIWLVLVLFMLTMLVGGGAYACIRGYHAFKDAIKVGGRMSKRFEAMSEPLPQPKENTSPFFTRPLEDAANRYIDAHAEVISRHRRTKFSALPRPHQNQPPLASCSGRHSTGTSASCRRLSCTAIASISSSSI